MTVNELANLAWGLIVGASIGGRIMRAIIAKILAWFGGKGIQRVLKAIPAVVAQVEDDYKKAMADGKITPIERKDLAMKTVEAIATECGMKLNIVTRWIISTIVDNVAKKLPPNDISIPDIFIKVKGTF